jgi:relaxase/mobilisation nuclease domain
MEEEMAATRLIALHINKGKTVAQCLNERLDYSQNPIKTEKGELISSYACDPETAAMEFLLSKRQYQQVTGQEYKGNIIAYQIRQSFKPGEITPEEANRLGYELAMHFTKGNHAFTVSTHTDRAHIHNHIIFNSTTLDYSRKFKNFFFSGIALQRLSDIVCFEHGYSIIERKPYADRTKRTEYPKRHTVRNEIRPVLDDLIRRKTKDWEDFLRLLAEEGYEIKRGKNIAIKGRAQQRFVRLKSLGEDYTEDALREKISRTNVRDSHHQTQQPGIDLLFDIQNRALGKGAGYEHWAKGFNLKQTAKTLLFLQQHDIHSYEDLERVTNEAATGADQQKDARIKEIEVLRQHIFDYSKTRKIYLEYKRLSKAKKAEFYELHRAEIELQEATRTAFDQLPEGTKLPSVKELNAERTRLLRERQAEYAEYRKAKADRTEFIRAKQNADVILHRQQEERDEKMQEKL